MARSISLASLGGAKRRTTSVVLNVTALTAMLLIAIPLGTVSAWRRGSRVDRLTGTLTYALYALPVFWAALLAQLVFAVELRWLPLYGLSSDGASALALPARLADRAAHLVLPVTCLAYGGVAYLSRFVRGVLLDAGAADAALAARARGAAAWAAMARHGTRLAAVPLLTLAGFLLPALVSGSVVVETVFAVPGLGELFVDAAFQRDLPVLLGLTLVSGAATLGGVLAADVACLLIDPRTRRD